MRSTKPPFIIFSVPLVIFAALAFALACVAATPIYRSMGYNNSSALAYGSGNKMTIKGSRASFAFALAKNVGVGDAIQYDSDGDDRIDAICFIHGRFNLVSFSVKDAAGTDPAAVTDDQDWRIFRAYTRLDHAESGRENVNINDNVRNFDIWENGKDISSATGSDETWNIACYADAIHDHSSRVEIKDWTTSAINFVRIFTPVSESEVGTSQRHMGEWDNSKFVFQQDGLVFWIRSDHVKLEGVQLAYTGSGSVGVVKVDGNSSYVSHCIIKNKGTGGDYRSTCIWYQTDNTDQFCHNNIIYDSENGIKFYWLDGGNQYVYNNTIYNCGKGITRSGNCTPVLINNLTQKCTDGYHLKFGGSWHLSSGHNMSDVALDAPGIYNEDSLTVAFVDSANDNFLLDATDVVAREAGTDLSSDPNDDFSYDILGVIRSDPWDVGGHEVSLLAPKGPYLPLAGGKMTSPDSDVDMNSADLTGVGLLQINDLVTVGREAANPGIQLNVHGRISSGGMETTVQNSSPGLQSLSVGGPAVWAVASAGGHGVYGKSFAANGVRAISTKSDALYANSRDGFSGYFSGGKGLKVHAANTPAITFTAANGTDSPFVVKYDTRHAQGLFDIHGETRLTFDRKSPQVRVNGNMSTERLTCTAGLEVKSDVTIAGNLAVAQTVVCDKIQIDAWTIEQAPDYVFEDSYKLAKLSDVEHFVKENKHLPEIPSAKEMNQKGLDLVDMNLKLLKKVEELTLYVIAQEKRLRVLEWKTTEPKRP